MGDAGMMRRMSKKFAVTEKMIDAAKRAIDLGVSDVDFRAIHIGPALIAEVYQVMREVSPTDMCVTCAVRNGTMVRVRT